MFDNYYPYRFIHKEKPFSSDRFLAIYKYTFTCKENHRYIVNVEEYENKIMVIKYYLKAHRDSANRYSLLVGNCYAPPIIRTCINILLDMYHRDNELSFGFIGASLIGEEQANSKRFRIYQMIMDFMFSHAKFSHHVYEKESAYILLNRINSSDEKLKGIEKMFNEIYLFE